MVRRKTVPGQGILPFEVQAAKAQSKIIQKIPPRFLKGKLPKAEAFEDIEYQQRAFRNILKYGNTLLPWPTGSKKTGVAFLLIEHILGQDENARIFFIAPQVVLTHEQKKELESRFNIHKIAALTGELSPERRRKVYAQNNVIFITPETLRNDLQKGITNLEGVRVGIFDEIDTFVGEHAGAEVGKMFKEKDILILGMTASIGHNEEKIKQLLSIFGFKHVEPIPEKKELEAHVKGKKYEVVKVQIPEEFITMRMILEKRIKETIGKLIEQGLVSARDAKGREREYINSDEIKEIERKLTGFNADFCIFLTLQNLKIYIESYGEGIFFNRLNEVTKGVLVSLMKGAHTTGNSNAYEWLKEIRNSENPIAGYLRYVNENGIGSVDWVGGWKAKVLNDPEFLKAVGALLEAQRSHPKIDALKGICTERVALGENVIIFVHYKNQAKIIAEELNKLEGISARLLVGHTEGMSRKEQIRVVEDFKQKKFNVLVATLAGERGQNYYADCAIKYDPVSDERREVQRDGRVGREKFGIVFVLLATLPGEEVSRDEKNFYAALARKKGGERKIAYAKKIVARGAPLIEEKYVQEGLL